HPLGGGETRRLTNETARDISDHFWKGPQRLVYLKDFAGDENFHLVAATVDGSGVKDLTPFDGVRAQIIDQLRDFPDELLVGRDKQAIVLVDPATAKEQQVLFTHAEVDVEGLSYSHKRKVLTEIDFVTWKTERKFLDVQTEKIYAALQKQLPGYEFSLQSMTD